MITCQTPTDWRDLQAQVATILRECGIPAESPRVIQTARGKIEVDVYAEETINGRRYVQLYECKLWKSSIPQSVVHAFRTQVEDAGANQGYIIVSSRFQSGAVLTAEFTPLKLLTWDEFQAEFERAWFAHHFVSTITEATDSFCSYVEPLLPAAYSDLPLQGRQAYDVLYARCQALYSLVMRLSPYIYFMDPTRVPIPRLPIRLNADDLATDDLYTEVCRASGLRELLHALIASTARALAMFRSIMSASEG